MDEGPGGTLLGPWFLGDWQSWREGGARWETRFHFVSAVFLWWSLSLWIVVFL